MCCIIRWISLGGVWIGWGTSGTGMGASGMARDGRDEGINREMNDGRGRIGSERGRGKM